MQLEMSQEQEPWKNQKLTLGQKLFLLKGLWKITSSSGNFVRRLQHLLVMNRAHGTAVSTTHTNYVADQSIEHSMDKSNCRSPIV